MAKLNKVRAKDTNFTTVFNQVIKDSSLSWKARGIFMYLWCLPDNWNFREIEIKNHSTDGKAALRTGLHELIKHHYLIIKTPVNSKNVKIGNSEWYLSDKRMSKDSDYRSPINGVLSSNSDNQQLLNKDKQTTDKLSKNSTNTDNGVAKIRRWIGNQLQQLGVININSFIWDDIDNWVKHYDPHMIKKAIKQVAETNPSPAWVVKDISTQLSRGCKVHQPKRHVSYGRQPIKQKLPKWARSDYHVKLHPTSKKLQAKIKKQLKEMSKHEKH